MNERVEGAEGTNQEKCGWVIVDERTDTVFLRALSGIGVYRRMSLRRARTECTLDIGGFWPSRAETKEAARLIGAAPGLLKAVPAVRSPEGFLVIHDEDLREAVTDWLGRVEKIKADAEPKDVPAMIQAECEALFALLLEKNKKYGNSALDPVRIFSRCSAEEQIRVRIDDKLSRISRGDAALEDEDVIQDLLGYLILLRVSRRIGAGPKVERVRNEDGSHGDVINGTSA